MSVEEILSDYITSQNFEEMEELENLVKKISRDNLFAVSRNLKARCDVRAQGAKLFIQDVLAKNEMELEKSRIEKLFQDPDGFVRLGFICALEEWEGQRDFCVYWLKRFIQEDPDSLNMEDAKKVLEEL